MFQKKVEEKKTIGPGVHKKTRQKGKLKHSGVEPPKKMKK